MGPEITHERVRNLVHSVPLQYGRARAGSAEKMLVTGGTLGNLWREDQNRSPNKR
jgi:hypothetical protein